jgi:putative redox protein
VAARQFEFTVDEPSTDGGHDTGPMPTEYLLGSLASCFALALAHSARKRGIELAPFRVRAEGTYDGPSFGSLRLVVAMDDVPDAIEALLERARRVCYVSNTIARNPRLDVTLA